MTICQSMGTQWLPGCFSSRVTQRFPENCRAQPLKLGHLVLRVNGRDYGLLSGWQGKNVRAANNCLASWRPLKRALCNNSSGGSSQNITWDAFSWARQQRVTLRFLTPGSGSVTAPAISRMQLSLAHKLTIQRNNWSCLVKFSMISHEVHVKIHASSTNRILWGGTKIYTEMVIIFRCWLALSLILQNQAINAKLCAASAKKAVSLSHVLAGFRLSPGEPDKGNECSLGKGHSSAR